MAARRYESFSSSVEKYFTSERSKRVKYFQHEKRNFVSPSDHVMLYLLYKHQWNTKPFPWNSFFPAKCAIYYVAIATVIFSHVKITCYFHVWRYHVFARKLTWYFTGVYIINFIISLRINIFVLVACLLERNCRMRFMGPKSSKTI